MARVSGLLIPYGPYGMTTIGRIRVLNASAVHLPADLTRVKLLDAHSGTARETWQSIGYLEWAEHRTEGLYGGFITDDSPAAVAAVAKLSAKSSDGVSVEMVAVKLHGDELASGDVTAFATVPIPAWADARLSLDQPPADVAANLTPDAVLCATWHGTAPTPPTREVITMTHPTAPAPQAGAPAAPAPQAGAPAAPAPQAGAPAAPAAPAPQAGAPAAPAAPAPQAGAPAAPAAPAPQAGAPAPLAGVGADALQASMTGQGAAPATPAERGSTLTLRQVTETMAALAVGNRSPELSAQLEDITYSSTVSTRQSAWLGELWTGVVYQRRYVPLLTARELTGLAMTGWRWVTPPEVAEYAGNKTPIPSNETEVEPYSENATRLAGGHDIDRAHYDFGNREFIESYWRKMAESYAKKSDQLALAQVLARAVASGETAGNLLLAAAIGADVIDEGTDGEAQATFVLVNRRDRRTLLEIASKEVPAYLKDILRIDPGNFLPAPIPQGTVIVGAKGALSHWELPGSPIRVEAEHLHNGGRDAALFGYRGITTNYGGGVVSVAFDPEADPAPPVEP